MDVFYEFSQIQGPNINPSWDRGKKSIVIQLDLLLYIFSLKNSESIESPCEIRRAIPQFIIPEVKHLRKIVFVTWNSLWW